MRYAIHEDNMDRLRKKMVRIQNKCRKYGCDFRFEEVGEEFRELKDEDGRARVARFVLVEAEGIAIVNGWRFIASVEHTTEGNVFSKAVDVEIPERYYDSDPICEHCGTNRVRKSTFIVQNEETGEFKQVGRGCLADFTHGMSAEAVAQYTAMFDELIEGGTPCGGGWGDRYYERDLWLRYVAETVRHFGYVRADGCGRSTRERAHDYYLVENGRVWSKEFERALREEMRSVGFDADSEASRDLVERALAWVGEQTDNSNYMHNLRTVCRLDYLTSQDLGIAASLFVSYDRALGREEKKRAEADAAAKSEWVGEVGDRVTVEMAEWKCVTGWETQWGYVGIYRIVSVDGNVFTWKTSGYIDEKDRVLTGTVKAHNEYRGTKQTELTRCRTSRGERTDEAKNRAVDATKEVFEAIGMLDECSA